MLRRSPENVEATLSIDIRNVITITIINLTNLAGVPTNYLENLEFIQPIDLRNKASFNELKKLDSYTTRNMAVDSYIIQRV